MTGLDVLQTVHYMKDWTEDCIATYFLEKGVPPEHIVLGFYDPLTREDTEFAVV